MLRINITIILLFVLFTGCQPQQSQPITIGINSWPGYEALYLAEKKGFLATTNANIELVQLGSLTDVLVTYTNGHIDGMTSTAIEVVQASHLSGRPLKVVMVPDYSNGGDVIIAHQESAGVADLKGKTVGAEVSSLGIYFLQRALARHGLKLSDVTLINLEQANGKALLKANTIDAFVTYPPYSIEILRDNNFHAIFSSAEIPSEIIDTMAISEEALARDPLLVKKLHKAWQMALDYMKERPEDAYRIMAKREGISVAEFKSTLDDLILLDSESQQVLLKNPQKLQATFNDICKTLVYVQALEADCTQQPNLIYDFN